MRKWAFITLVMLSMTQGSLTEKIECKNEEGKGVDWFIAYKLPKIDGNAEERYKDGAGYFYLLPGVGDWIESKHRIDSTNSLIEITFRGIKSNLNGSSVNYLAYNDQPPHKDSVYYGGHTKGVIAADVNGGFWLPHSSPKFPDFNDMYGEMNDGRLINGQMFLCLSLNLKDINQIGESMQYTFANVYKHHLPDKKVTEETPAITDAVNGKKSKSKPHRKLFDVKANNYKFHVLAKGPKFHRDIYANWIANYFNSTIEAQTWRQGKHSYGSNCTDTLHSVENVLVTKIGTYNFSTEVDHSKWAVGVDRDIICVADLNRTKPQRGRGGVAVCIKSKSLKMAFSKIISSFETCPNLRNRGSKPKRPKHLSMKDKWLKSLKTNEIF